MYDSLGRTISRTLPNGKSETMTYNVLGQVTSKTDFNGKATSFAYDVRGRLLSKTPDATLNEEPITFSYPNELTKVVTRGTNITTYRTDLNRGWLNAVENSGVVDGRIEYSYDASGNKTSGESVAIQNGVEQKNKTLFTYDALGRTDLVTFSDATTTRYGYDIVGNRETVTRSNGANTLYRFDNQHRLTYQQNSGAAGSNAPIFSTFAYTVRADGKRTGVREQVLNPLSSGVAHTTRSIAYDFDKAGRLASETREERQSLRAGGETSSTRISGYEFDEVSNRKKLTTNSYNGIGVDKTLISTNTVDYSYNNADELTEETTTNGANTTSKTYSYDDNGAQTSISANGVVTPYSYDFEGKLVEVGNDTSSTRSSYVYDGDGNRLSAIVTSNGVAKTVRYLNDINTAYVQVLEERNENGVLQARYDNGDGDTQRLYRRRESDGLYLNRWYLGDGLESTRQLVDANGVVTDSYAYDAFGLTLQRAGETENTRLYNGQQQDESGLYFLRARYYNTGNGRFLNHDPILGNSNDPVTLHRYLYCANDPVNGTDPSGEFTVSNVVVTAGIMGGLAGGLRSYIAGDGPAGIIGNAIIGAGFGAAGAALIAANPALAPYLFGVGSGLTGRQVAVDIQQGRWDLAAYDMALFAAALGTYKYSPALKSARPRRQLYAGGPRRTTPTSELKAQLRAVVDEDPAYYDYFEHGNQDGFVHVADDGITRTPISVAEVAAQIKADPNWGGRPVRVFACDAGIRSDGPAKQLASLLGVQTHAPPGKVAFAWKPWYITDDPANGTDMGQALVPFDP